MYNKNVDFYTPPPDGYSKSKRRRSSKSKSKRRRSSKVNYDGTLVIGLNNNVLNETQKKDFRNLYFVPDIGPFSRVIIDGEEYRQNKKI